jgi:hypothetical protein
MRDVWEPGPGSGPVSSALRRRQLTLRQSSLDKRSHTARSPALKREKPVTKVATTAKHPVRPAKGRIDVAAAHARVAARFPKTLAKLAE